METKLGTNAEDVLKVLGRHDITRALAGHLGLSPRQVQVARLICQGLANHEMVSVLNISSDTVRLHRRCLFRKLEITDRVGVPVRLILAARQVGAGQTRRRRNLPRGVSCTRRVGLEIMNVLRLGRQRTARS